MEGIGQAVDLVVDVANVMGSRPDGWWRDRAGAAARLVGDLAELPGVTLPGPDAGPGRVRIERVFAVVEGQARGIEAVAGIDLVRAPRDGDAAIVDTAHQRLGAGAVPLVVTADRGLRAAVPGGTLLAGPRWLRAVLGTG